MFYILGYFNNLKLNFHNMSVSRFKFQTDSHLTPETWNVRSALYRNSIMSELKQKTVKGVVWSAVEEIDRCWFC